METFEFGFGKAIDNGTGYDLKITFEGKTADFIYEDIYALFDQDKFIKQSITHFHRCPYRVPDNDWIDIVNKILKPNS